MINLLYCGNYKIFDGVLISLLSAVKHTKEAVHTYLLTMDLSDIDENFKPFSEEQRKYLEDMVKEKNKTNSVKLIDITSLYKKSMLNSKNLRNHFTPYAQLRLFADIVPEIPDKIIYLDTDTIVNSSLRELYYIDINNYELACVDDLYNWLNPNRWKVRHYFNSGVLLLNMKAIRKTKLFTKARQMVATKKMISPDQDALNFIVKKKLVLPEKFNAKDKYYKDIVVHHFCNVRKKGNFFFRVKPWMVDLVKQKMNAYDSLLDEYLERKKAFEEQLEKTEKKKTPKKEKHIEINKNEPEKKEPKPEKEKAEKTEKDTTIG